MTVNDMIYLRRKENVGLLAVIFWTLGLLLINATPLQAIFLPMGWFFTTYWLALDAKWRKMPVFRWVALWTFTAPLGLLLYFLNRNPVPAACYRCGSQLDDQYQICHVCGYQTYLGRLVFTWRRMYRDLSLSLAHGPVEKARNTVEYMVLAVVALVLFEYFLRLWQPNYQYSNGFVVLFTLSFAAYWILVPWWIYLDARFRNMESGVAWAILALLTNVFGLVTYLVIRNPDPKVCPECKAPLTLGLKHCPYCGAETEPVCPSCQSVVQPDWLYCPACSGKLAGRQVASPNCALTGPVEGKPLKLSICGTVTDADSGLPIQGAEVRIDSKTIASSTHTDPLGRFVLSDLEVRPYVVLAVGDGYALQAKPFTPSAAKSEQLRFVLHQLRLGNQLLPD